MAPGDSTVLILGETGTGKELIARALPCAHAVKSRTDAGASSAGKLARLLLSDSPVKQPDDSPQPRIRSCLTHEEMAR